MSNKKAFVKFVMDRTSKGIAKVDKTEEMKEKLFRQDELYDSLCDTLSEEQKKLLLEFMDMMQDRTIMQMCVGYRTGLLDGIMLKYESAE